jgi:hypothetical protein
VGKKFTVFAVRQCKNARQTFFFCRAPMQKRTAKHLFAVRPKNTHGKHLGARQIWSFP